VGVANPDPKKILESTEISYLLCLKSGKIKAIIVYII